MQQELAKLIKGCISEGKCERLGARFDDAKQLGVRVDELIDMVFEIAGNPKA